MIGAIKVFWSTQYGGMFSFPGFYVLKGSRFKLPKKLQKIVLKIMSGNENRVIIVLNIMNGDKRG